MTKAIKSANLPLQIKSSDDFDEPLSQVFTHYAAWEMRRKRANESNSAYAWISHQWAWGWKHQQCVIPNGNTSTLQENSLDPAIPALTSKGLKVLTNVVKGAYDQKYAPNIVKTCLNMFCSHPPFPLLSGTGAQPRAKETKDQASASRGKQPNLPFQH